MIQDIEEMIYLNQSLLRMYPRNSYLRLYRILDTLFTIFEKIGERITNDLRIQIGKDTVDFEVIESTVKVNQ